MKKKSEPTQDIETKKTEETESQDKKKEANNNSSENKTQTVSPENLELNSIKAQISSLEEKLTEAEKTAKEQKDSALRAMAELENFKRRKQQEVDSFKKYAGENFIKELLPVLDSFDYACDHTKDSEPNQKMVEGFLLIQKQFHNVLDKFNVTPIDALNKPFDPNQHEAISKEKKEGTESETVIKEMQKGYKLYDRVIRPSMVVISE